ncbi:MAG: response regulator, partial [Longimicrobiales bacterium]|nr:response regulator [Longimicrobiales bacterium]
IRLEVSVAKILVVDWEEEERVYLWSVLEEAGHELLFASDGQAALEVWGNSEVDLVITELYLPELNGLRLIKELKARDPDGLILAISEISADQLDLAEDYGACQILAKPVSPDKLLAGVRKALENYRPVRRIDWR